MIKVYTTRVLISGNSDLRCEQDCNRYSLNGTELAPEEANGLGMFLLGGDPAAQLRPDAKTFGASGDQVEVSYDENQIQICANEPCSSLSADEARELALHLLRCAEFVESI